MSWPPGTQIICIDDSKPKIPGAVVHGHPLVAGMRYTVRVRGCEKEFKRPAVCLVENTISHPEYDTEFPWTATRFRLADPVPPLEKVESAESQLVLCDS